MKQPKYVTPHSPWEMLAIEDGDTILFEGGYIYPPFCLKNVHNICVGSYGFAPAVIDGSNGNGVELSNVSNARLFGLVIKGNGWKENRRGIGVLVYGCTNVTVQNLEVFGFQQSGIEIVSSRNITVEGCYAHNNGFCGINTRITDNQNENITVRYCKALDNGGSPAVKDNHSGSGIGIFHTRNAVVEYCEAAGNGWAQRQRNINGPVGIWCACDVDTLVFRYNIARHNRTQPGGVDGDGFDIDGGVVNALMEYNYSYENEGSGYLFCEYGSGLDYRNNRMEACVSLGDATRVPQQGSVQYYGPDWLKLEESVSRDCLLMPAPGKPCVVNGELGNNCRDMSLLDSVMIPSDAPAVSDLNSQVLRLDGNTFLEDAALYRQLSDTIPQLYDPRILPELSVFTHLKNQTLTPHLQKGSWGELFGAPKPETLINGKHEFTYYLGGKDFAGSDYSGDAALVYDSLKPGFALEMKPNSDIRFEYLAWDSSRRHLAVLTARLVAPDVTAFFYIAENDRIVKAIPISGTVSGYQKVYLPFSGFDGVPYLGVVTEDGTAAVLLDKVEIYKLAADAPMFELPDSDSSLMQYTMFGDIYEQGEAVVLRGAGARLIGRLYQPGRVTLQITADADATGTAYLQCGDRTVSQPLQPGWQTIRLTIDSPDGTVVYGVRNDDCEACKEIFVYECTADCAKI